MLEALKSRFSGRNSKVASAAAEVVMQPLFEMKGATGGGSSQLQPQELPTKGVKPKQQSYPGYVTSLRKSTSVIPQPDLQSANQDIVATYRLGANTPTVIRNLARVHPDFSAAVSAHLRMGIPEKYIAIARDPDGTFNIEATRMCLELLRRWSSLANYETGFSQTDSLRSVAEACGKEGILYGGMMLELVLDKARMPSELSPISVTQIKFYEDDKGLKPVQVVGGEEIDLDLPTIFYVSLDASILDPYPQSPMEPAIQAVLASAQFLMDMRRLVARNVYPRYDITINEEILRKNIPQETQLDDEKLTAFMNNVFTEVEDMVSNLGVEQAIAHFDYIEVKFVEGSDATGTSDIFNTVKEIYDAKVATGAKTLPAVLGHGAGSQNIASTETMLAMMTANSMVRLKLQELFSRALTMACRVTGQDVTVEFEYDTIDLRPAAELEAFRTMREERLRRQLSMGAISDEEYCLRTTGNLPPPTWKPLSGTMFMDATATTDGAGNPYSGSPSGGGQSGGGASNQSQKSKQPQKAKGPAK